MESYDVVIIGSGPNGLSAAIELAKNDLKVIVVEAKETIGGGTRTSELTLPGFHHDVCSAVHPLAALSPYLKTLPLQDFGLEWLYPQVSVAHPLKEEPAVILSKFIDETAKQLGVDGKAWKELFGGMLNNGDELLKDVLGPLKFPNSPIPFLKFGLKAMQSAEGLTQQKFKGERAKALFAGLAAHSVMPLDYQFSSAIGLVLGISAHMVDWPVAKGGSESISKALASYFTSLGGEIQTGLRVHSLKELPASKIYVFDTDPSQLLQIARDELPNSYHQRVKAFNYGPGTFKIDWALDESIPWKDINCRKASTVHVGGDIAAIAKSERMAWKGKHAEEPFVLLCQQSEVDSSRAPKGKHTGYAYCHVPQGSLVNMTDRIERQIETFAPGFKDVILARHITNTADLQNYNPNYVGGSITGGASNFSQLFARPVVRLDPYSTPNERIFICSASTPPGGGVHGMCGYWAAQSVLKRLKKL